MATKLINKIETSITVISLIASMIGMAIISFETWKFLNEHFDETVKLLVKLF